MKTRFLALSAISLAALATAGTARAADEAEETAPAADSGSDKEIVVTAQLREQKEIDVPITLSTVTAEQMDRFGINEFDALSRYTPGFVVQNQSPNQPSFVIRGITSDSSNPTDESRVSVFQDGVSISRTAGSYVELFDIARVEVAKGPQTTLYGRGALIGAVNIVENKADPSHFEAAAKVSYGNYNSWIGEGMVNLPLSDNVAIRIAGRVRDRDGYVKNDLGGEDYGSADTKAIRGSFHAQTGGFTFDLIGNYEKDQPSGTPFKQTYFLPTNPATGAVVGDDGRNSGGAMVNSTSLANGAPLGVNRQVWGITSLIGLQLDSHTKFNSTTAYRQFDSLEVFDADGLSLPLLTAENDDHGKQFSQDFRFTYQDSRLTAFAGASYFYEQGYQAAPALFNEGMLLADLAGYLAGGSGNVPLPQAYFQNSAFTGQLLQGVLASRLYPIYGAAAPAVAASILPTAQAQAIAGNMLPGGHLESYTNGARTDSVDLYADATFKVTDKFEIGAGVRWSHDSKQDWYAASVADRSILGGFVGALGYLTTSPATTQQLLGALAVPGAAHIPTSALYPVPMFGISAQPTAGNGNPDYGRLSSGGFSWRVTARYKPSDLVSFYATYARGRRPEVLSTSGPALPGSASPFTVVPDEKVDSYEAGFKTALLNRRLFLDGAGYYYKYSNFQTTVQQGTQFITTNAGKAESYGLDVSLRWVPTDILSFFATYGYNHSRFKSGAYSGNRMRLAPDSSGSVGAIVSVPAGPGRLDFSPSMTWQSMIFFDDNNDRPALQTSALVPDTMQDEFQKGYVLANARLGYAWAGWRIEGYVTNLFNRKYIIDAGNIGDSIGLPTFIAGQPRFYGVSLSAKFGGHR